MLNRFNYNVLDNLKHITCPILIVHSKSDKTIPIHHGIKLFDAANEPKEFLEIEGDHYDGFLATGQRYEDNIDKFITKYA